MRFRKKPAIVDAYLFENKVGEDKRPQWILDAESEGYLRFRPRRDAPPQLEIKTIDSIAIADIGDWVIRGTKGEFYPCKPDIFVEIYEPVE